VLDLRIPRSSDSRRVAAASRNLHEDSISSSGVRNGIVTRSPSGRTALAILPSKNPGSNLRIWRRRRSVHGCAGLLAARGRSPGIRRLGVGQFLEVAQGQISRSIGSHAIRASWRRICISAGATGAWRAEKKMPPRAGGGQARRWSPAAIGPRCSEISRAESRSSPQDVVGLQHWSRVGQGAEQDR